MTDIVILDGARTAIGTFGRSPMLGALNCPFGSGHMGVTDENAAAGRGIPARPMPSPPRSPSKRSPERHV